MRLRLYLDEDVMDAGLVRGLRLRAVDFLTAAEAGNIRYADELHLEFAAREGRALYSFNIRDYIPIHARFVEQQRPHAGIVLAQQGRYSIGEQLRRLLILIAEVPAEDMRDQVVFLSSWG